ncbi:hypothetical protein HK100_012244, partial [Physocladia obscura]
MTISRCLPSISSSQLITRTETDITAFFKIRTPHVHHDRLVYCIAGMLFAHTSPDPFGGTKSKPGYANFDGESVASLLRFIVSAAYFSYWGLKGREGLESVVYCVNRVVMLHSITTSVLEVDNKYVTDELLLNGMKRSGHIEWYGGGVKIVPWLQFHPENQLGVYFTP